MISLKDRTALITGASRGLGKVLAREFLAAGARIVVCARDSIGLQDAVNELGAEPATAERIFACPADVCDGDSVKALAEFAQEKLGRVDILLNNAGIYGPKGPIEEIPWQDWKRAIEINLFGPVLLSQALIPQFKKLGSGKIINLSGGGATAPLPRLSAYASSKAALVRLTETLAHELLEYKIDVNAVAPGALNTRMLDEILEAGPDKVGADYYARAIKQRDQGGASLEKAAALCVYLASTASNGITGRLISAAWDPWENLQSYADRLKESDIYTLRRIIPSDRGEKWGDK